MVAVPDVDVVVAGAGGAGLCAALAAAERGLSVVVVEHREKFREGCNTAMSTAMVPAGGTRWQTAFGIEDSPAMFFEDVMRKTKGTVNASVAGALTSIAPDLVEWLAGPAGVPLSLVTDFSYPGHSADRCHTVPDRSGRTLHRHLLERVARAGVEILVPARLVSVETRDDAVSSVTWTFPDNSQETVSTSNVILGVGGFGGDPDRVALHIPEIAGAWHFGSDGNVGDALAIGEALHADTGWLDAYQGHGSVATPHGVLVTWATVMLGAIIVNRDGRRFADETRGYSEFARLVLDQPGGEAWVIFDSRIDDACRQFKDHQDLLASGAVRVATSTRDLAQQVSLPFETIAQTLLVAQELSQLTAESTSVGDPFGRVRWSEPLSPPYMAVRVTGALFHTQGGLLVDGHARVLREGKPLRGLFAAGGSAVGMSGRGADGYLAGNGLLAALGFGLLAGRSAGG